MITVEFDTIEQLAQFMEILDEYREELTKPIKLPANHGKPWDFEQRKYLVEAISSWNTIEDIAIEMGRTTGSIIAQYELIFDQFDWRECFHGDPALVDW